jgi:hypothetical protein
MNQVPPDKLTVYRKDGGWWIGSAGSPDGPYTDEQAAIDEAIDRAKELKAAGHPSTVQVQRGSGSAQVWPLERSNAPSHGPA